NSVFEKDVTYYVKNDQVTNKYGKVCFDLTQKDGVFKTSQLPLSEEDHQRAMDVLLPSSKSGEEQSLFVDGGYVTFTGKKHNVSSFKFNIIEVQFLTLSLFLMGL
ncbi:MAG: hypothetical protein ACRC7H_03180, partial [Plesiomonas shigelloides]